METLSAINNAILKGFFISIAFLTTGALFAQEAENVNGDVDGIGGFMGNGVTWFAALAVLLIIVVIISKSRKKNV